MASDHWKRKKNYKKAGGPSASQMPSFDTRVKAAFTGVEKVSVPSAAITSSMRDTADPARQEKAARYAKSVGKRNCKNCGIFKNRNNKRAKRRSQYQVSALN